MKPHSILLMFVGLVVAAALATPAIACHGSSNCCCICPPPPVKTILCVKDPCSCCVEEVEVCIPACCANEAPCVTWRDGIFGRRVATYTWECCDHEIDVIITKHGRVKVRD